MDESQIARMCDNETLLSKRIQEAEELLNENHWTKQKVTLEKIDCNLCIIVFYYTLVHTYIGNNNILLISKLYILKFYL